MLQFIPEEYLDFPFHPSYPKNKELEKKREEWYHVYEEFLEDRKFPEYGQARCRGCILNNSPSKSLHDSLIRILLKGVTNDDGTKIEFPCNVRNIFSCPHKQSDEEKGGSGYFLFGLQDVCKIIEDTLTLSHDLVPINTGPHDLDFEKRIAYDGFFGSDSRPTGQCSITLASRELKSGNVSRVPVQSIKEIYKVLTDKKLLDIILEQYENDLTSQISDPNFPHWKNRTELESLDQYIKKNKKTIIGCEIKLRKKIKIEEIRDFEG
jgi:hypothetical protein